MDICVWFLCLKTVDKSKFRNENNEMSIIINFKKNFADWFLQKPKIDCNSKKPPFVKEGQIYWCSIGENIGTEISGKGEIFTRPVVIHTKLSKFTFLVIPTSTKIKDGSWFVKFTHNKIRMIACLN